MKTKIMSLFLIAAIGVTLFGQDLVEINYNWYKKNYICVNDQPLELSIIMKGQWSGPGVIDNIFYPSTVPVSKIKLNCDEKKLIMNVRPIPFVDLGWMPKEVKLGSQAIQLTGYPNNGKWSDNGNPFDGNFIPKEVGIHEIFYIVSDQYGCTGGALNRITVK